MLMILFLAATISSEQLGQFFTLPSGIPSAASSSNTPGSDPTAGGGWYIAEYTNVLSQSWDVYYGSEASPLLSSAYIPTSPTETPEYENLHVSLVSYDIWNARLKVTGESFADPGTNIVVPAESTDVIWNGYVLATVDETGETKRYGFSARLIRRFESVPTGKYVPRSPRLTPEIYAGVNSTFEAFLERQYYAGQGQSNVWDMTQWGPRDDYTRFWFDPYWMRTGGTGSRYTYNGWDYSTNRTVMTRRLSEYEQIDSLADYVVDDMCAAGRWHLSQPERPGWIESSEGYLDDSSCWWSTTDTRVLAGTRIVPSFSWVANPMTSADWSTCSQTFSILASDDVWNGNEEYYDLPTAKMMNGLSFGQRIERWDWRDAIPEDVECSFGGLITNVFTHADGWAVTNGTRRLFSDRICCMNQTLSLMDRTYHVPQVAYPTTGTNAMYTNSKTWEGTISATPTWNGESWTLSGFTPIIWESPTSTNRVTRSSMNSSGNAISRSVSKTSTEASDDYAVFVPPIPLAPQYGDEDDYIRDAITEGLVFNDGDSFFMSISHTGQSAGGINFSVHILNGTTGNDITLYRVDHLPSGMLSFNVIFNYNRRYSYAHTTGDIDFGPTQPGYQAGNRNKASKIGNVVGIHRRWGNGLHNLALVGWSDSYSAAQYNSGETTYNGRDSLVTIARNAINVELVKFIQLYGANPDNPGDVIPISDSDANRVRNSIVIVSGYYGFAPDCDDFATGTYSDGHAVTHSYYSVNRQTSEWNEGWNALATANVSIGSTMDSPSQTDTDGLHTDAKIGVITRTDWNWKALKRGND